MNGERGIFKQYTRFLHLYTVISVLFSLLDSYSTGCSCPSATSWINLKASCRQISYSTCRKFDRVGRSVGCELITCTLSMSVCLQSIQTNCVLLSYLHFILTVCLSSCLFEIIMLRIESFFNVTTAHHHNVFIIVSHLGLNWADFSAKRLSRLGPVSLPG